MIQINPANNQPIFEQIISQIKMLVLKGYLRPGDSIPSVRKLALKLSVTPGTVARAYGELEKQNVIVTVRGKGTYIAEQCDSNPSEAQLEQGYTAFRGICMDLIYMGIRREELDGELDEIYGSIVR